MGWATGYSGRWESRFDFQSVGLSFSCPALVTDKAKRVEPVPGSKGIKKAPALSPEASSGLLKSREASPDAPTLSQSTDHTRATKSLSKKCKSLSKKNTSQTLFSFVTRALIMLLGSAATWPLAAGSQQRAMSVVSFLHTWPPPARFAGLFSPGRNCLKSAAGLR